MNASEKSAIVMLTLGDVLAAEVFKHLNAHEVKQISASMVNMAGFTHDQMAMVLEEFKKDSSEYAALSLNTNDYLRSVLVKALGDKDVFSFGLLVMILIFRPQGLLGRPVVAKV